MRKTYLFCVIFFIGYTQIFAKPITEAEALLVGQNFMRFFAIKANKSIVLTKIFPVAIEQKNGSDEKVPYFVFAIQNQKGFVMVAGDDASLPILGYGHDSDFVIENMPEHIAKWFEEYRKQIQYIQANNLQASDDIKFEWEKIRSANAITMSITTKSRTKSVSPLVTTRWNQSPFYNALCPYDNTANERTVSGCVATAMAQVMKYHNYPAQGTGFYSYNHPQYGTLSANFGNTTYNWASMPNNVTSTNNAVATLMYHCGIGVRMNYGVSATGGSGAFVISSATNTPPHCSEYALKTYFGYPTSIQGVRRTGNYTDAQWIALLKVELDASRPILYAGFGSGGGHAFVADGYDNNNFFHFNWGWGGSVDGYFGINALNPGSLGTGGGSGGYNSNHQAIIGIRPPAGTSTNTYNLRLTTNLSLTPSNGIIAPNGAFSVSANLTNTGTGTFTGDYAAALFNAQGSFVAYIETKTGINLQSGFTYTNPLVFSTTGISNATPGQYTIGIFAKPTGGNWQAVGAGSGGQVNSANLSVVSTSSIVLNSNIIINTNPIVKGQSFTVTHNIVNNGATNFSGNYVVALYKSTGEFVSIVEEKTGMSLSAGFTYTNPLTFTGTSTLSTSLDAGGYLIAAWFKPTAATDYILMGNGSFTNPVSVNVVLPAISPDMYEANNTETTARTLNVNFGSNNIANLSTTNSNFHIGTDYDFYKITLSPNFDYVITARLHDSYLSGNGQTYTCDAAFSYKIDNNPFSQTFDDVMPNTISVVNGGNVIFWVSPYFQGNTGSYLLDIQIQRNPPSALMEVNQINLKIYPNPTTEELILETENNSFILKNYQILNTQGQYIQQNTFDNANETKKSIINVQTLPQGLYILKLETEKGIFQHKFIKK